MRFMVLVKATKNSEAGEMPSQELLAAMMKYTMPNEDSDVEIRQVFSPEDFGEAFTPELQAQEKRILAEAEKLRK